MHDIILFYSKSAQYTWNRIDQPYEKDYIARKDGTSDERGPYMSDNLTGAGTTHGDSGKPWRGYDPTTLGRHWSLKRELVEGLVGKEVAAKMSTQEKLDLLDEHGYIHWTKKGKSGEIGFPRIKLHLDIGIPAQDVIIDIPPINSQAQERLGCPTQKPVALLERILKASSNEGDVVLDPFCGCGTTVHAAQKLNRQWSGIDITSLATSLIKTRLTHAFGKDAAYQVIREPTTTQDAELLAKQDPYQFQWWSLGLVEARPLEQKKGADKGIDGRLYFHDAPSGKTKQVIDVAPCGWPLRCRELFLGNQSIGGIIL